MKATLFAAVVPLLLAGCTTPSPLPEVMAYKSPVIAGAKVPSTHHHTTLTGYTHREPTAPEPWVTEDETAITPEEAIPEDAMAPEKPTAMEVCKKKEGASDDCPVQ